jgi:DNA helicase II / ATP-dependent DNA helicase PcrA
MPQHIVDLHIHSHYSRATSRDMNLSSLYKWAKIKGIHVMGTGDFTHPEWFAELREQLVPDGAGLYRLRPDLAVLYDKELPASVASAPVRFVPSVEIATIYSKGGRVRKLHNLVIAPSLDVAFTINNKLATIGNLAADGRPILGLDSKSLLEIALDASGDCLFIPAHVWTPWFGLFGSKSGFFSIEEAYENLASEIRAVETGLSSDPFMNWRKTELQSRTIVSNSDAHSPRKLGREANIVDCELSYKEVIGAITTNDRRFVGTIEFFPEEGKYFLDGHRACGVRLTPDQTKKLGGLCPKCAKPLVVGVQYQVDALADKPALYHHDSGKIVEYIIPLAEMIAETVGVKSVSSRRVVQTYDHMIAKLGNEFDILRSIPVDQIRDAEFHAMALAIERLRAREVLLDPGYDGVFGTIKVFEHVEIASGMHTQSI